MAFDREADFAKHLVEEAGSLALEYQRLGVATETKQDESPVTAADRACEKLIVEKIAQTFPDDGVLGEEGANRAASNGRKWIIDPIDGTRDFVRGIPLWAVLIGFEVDGEVVAGAAYSPGQRLLAWASQGSGAWVNGERIHVSQVTEPSQAVVSFNGLHKAGVERYAGSLVSWLQRSWAVRGLGGAVDAILVAQGRADIWIEPNASPWDFAPFKILTEEAGGVFKSFAGEKTIYGGNGYACPLALEPYVHELLYSEK